MRRRDFLCSAAMALAQTPAIPILDTHIHLFDPSRPQGVPWPNKNNAVLYQPALPDRYRKIATPFGIQGAIEVECSPWLEDNQWVLDVAARDPLIVGMIGNLEPEKADFPKHLDRFHKNPLFLGIRCGTLWGRDFHAQVNSPDFVAGIKRLGQAGLTLDTANPNPAFLADLARLAEQVPDVRIVIDHLPQMQPSPETEPVIRRLAQRPRTWVKISEVLRRVDGRVPTDLEFYRSRIDMLFDLFGADRVLYGSDWPNSDQWGDYRLVFSIVRDYFTAKGSAAMKKYFWENSVAAYRWKTRPAGPG